MSQLANMLPHELNPQQNRSTHLPSEAQLKKQLKDEIESYINELKETEGNESKIETLTLRKKLIDSHGLSIQRIDNLQVIFLHYCSHIFKTGKHMTFERLEYEKSHLTMDRFFVFLKDFSLTVAKIDGVNKEVIDKNDIVLLFKKVSINAKDLNFQQFISCLEKIGLLYYDSMLNYNARQQKIAEDRKRRKQHYLRSLKRRKAALEAAKNRQNIGQNNEQPEGNQNKKTQHGEEEQQAQNSEHENDKLVQSLINDKNIEDPTEQVKVEIAKMQDAQLQNIQNENGQQQIGNQQQEVHVQSKQNLLKLTREEKIQYFYQLINVDNAAAFKRKMRELNLPLFQTKHHRNMSQAQKLAEPLKESKLPQTARDQIVESDEQKRLQQLRNKIEQRKERDKGSTPHISKQDYQQRKRKREKEEVQATVIVRKDHRKKKIDINELEIDLSSLSNMAHENINFQRFNPHKLIQPTEEEDPYLEEYNSAKKTQRSQKRILSNFESNDGRSQVMLEKMKKRAQQIEIRQRNAESKYSSNSEALVSTQHQIRKNRLVEKLMKIYKQ